MNFCPNLSNKKIKLEFDELVSILGEDAAYLIWDRSQGNGLELAPNGASSKLFLDLLEHYKGDRRLAIIAKAKTYTDNFLNWFGDWVGVSKPQVKYYGPTMGKTTAAKTNKDLVDFDDIVRSDIKKLAEKQGKTVRLIKIESGEEYKQLLLSAIDKWRSDDNNIGKTLVVSNAVLSTENIFDNTPSIPSKEEFVKRLVQRSEDVSKTKKQLEEEASLYYDDLLKRNPNLKIEDRFVSDLETGVSKVVDENGEPLVVYHGTNIENIEVFDRNKGKEHGTFTATNKLGSFFTDIKSEAKGYATVTWLQNSKQGNPTIYNGFVNIKNPLYFNTIHELRQYMMSDFEYDEEGDPVSKVTIDVKYDGVIVKQVNQSNLAKEFIIRNSNQIKSVGNEGEYSTTNDNIYQHKKLQLLLMLNRFMDHIVRIVPIGLSGKPVSKKWIRPYNKSYYTERSWWINKTIYDNYEPGKNIALDIKRILLEKGYPENLLSISGRKITLNTDFVDLIPEHLQKTKLIHHTISELCEQYGITIKMLPRVVVENIVKKDLSGTDAVYHKGVIYILNKNGVSDDIAAEEFIHPVIDTIEQQNPELFNNLLKEAREKFPKLRIEIEGSYDEDLINQELVTQAVARAFVEDRKNNKDGHKLSKLVHLFLQGLVDLINNKLFGKGTFGGNRVKVNQINVNSKITDIAKLLNMNDAMLDVDIANSRTRLHIGNKRKQQMRQQLSKLNSFKNNSELLETTIDYIEQLGEDRKAGGDPKTEKAALWWVIKDGLRFPDDIEIFNRAIDIIQELNLDYTRFNSPAEVIYKHLGDVKAKPINPDTVPEFTNKLVLNDGIVVYDVQDDFDGLVATRKIVDTHWGEDSNPWCLVTRRNGINNTYHIGLMKHNSSMIKSILSEYYNIKHNKPVNFEKLGFTTSNNGFFHNVIINLGEYRYLNIRCYFYDLTKDYTWEFILVDENPELGPFPPDSESFEFVDADLAYYILKQGERYLTSRLNEIEKNPLYSKLTLEYAYEMWNRYSAYLKQIAFKNGKLHAFNANNASHNLWWNIQDMPFSSVYLVLSKKHITPITEEEFEFIFGHDDEFDYTDTLSVLAEDADDYFRNYYDLLDQLAIEEADVTWMSAKSNLTNVAQPLIESGLCTGQKTSFGSYVIEKTGEGVPSYRNTKSQIAKRLNIEGYAPSFEKVKDNNGNTITVLHSVSDISELKEDTEGYGENEEKVNRVLSFIQLRFPGLKVVWHNQNDPSVPSTSSANAWIDGDTVHLVRGRINGHIVIEEFLHPFIAVILHEYPSLFNDLLESAKKEFPKLCKQIENTYSSKSKQVLENEMVTLALSRLVNTYRHDQSKLSTKLKNIVFRAVEYIQDIFNKVFEKVGVSKRINITSLKDRVKTIEDLANIITSNDFVHTYNQTELIAKYQNARDESLSLKEQLTERYQRLFESYKRTPNKSKRRELILNEIHDLLTKLRSQSDEDAVRESVAFAVQAIGLQDIIQTQPLDYIDTTNLTGEDRERAIRKNRSRNIFSFLYQEAHRSDGAPDGTTDPTYQNFSGVTADDIVNIEKHALSFYEKLYKDVISKAKIKTTEVSGLSDTITQVRELWQDATKAVGDRIVDEYIGREFSNYTELERENMKTVFKDWLHENSFANDISEFWGGKLKNFSYSNNEIIKQMFHEIQKKNAKTMREVQPHVDRINKAWKRANGITKTFKGHWQEIMMERDRRGRYTGNFVRDVNHGQYVQDLEEFVKELNDEFDTKYGKHYEKNDLGDWVSSTGIAIEDDDSELWGTTGNEDDDMPTFYKYLDRLYEWKSKHANMRYTYNYYKERMSRPYTMRSATGLYDPVNHKDNHGLQPRTFLKYERIQSNINYYLDKCADPETGLCYVENLDEQDRLKLEMWQDQLDELSNPFNIDGTKKEGDELLDAIQIRAWLRWINEKLYTKHDQDAFNEYYQLLLYNGASKEELDNFLKYNARYGISPRLMDWLNSQFENVEQGHAAINMELFKAGLYSLVRGEDDFHRDLELMLDHFEFWKNCRVIQEGLQRTQSKSEDNAKIAKKFLTKELLISPYTTNNGAPMTWVDYVIEHYVLKAKTLGLIPGIDNVDFSSMSEDLIRNYFHKIFYVETLIVKKNGTREVKENPLDIFYVTVPLNDNERGYKAIGRFKSKTNKSTYDMYVNPDYDTSSVESEQPLAFDPATGEQMYDNSEAFNKLGRSGSAVRDLYDVLVDEMKQAQLSINTHNVMFNYKLPQLNASNIAILSRIGTYGVSDTIKKMYEGFVTVQENDTEMRTKDSYITNPDGSKAMSLPLRYYYDLEDKSTVATDVTGMVKLFVHMATNYKNSADIESMMKVLLYNLHRGEGEAGKNSEDLAKQLMQRHFYEDVWNDEEAVSPEDRKSTFKSYILDTIASALGCTILGTTAGVATLGISKVFAAILGTTAGLSTFGVPFAFGIGGLTIGILASTYSNFILNKVSNTKLYKILHRYSVLRTLGFNWLSAAVGFLDSSTRIIEEAFTGKYINPYNLAVGIFQTLVNLPKYVFNIGNPVPNNKMTALMLLNQISKSFTEINKNTNRSRARRILGNLAMGPFGMFDWLTNQCLLRSYYSNCRFYLQVPDGPAIKTGFYTDYEFEQALNNLGLDAVTRDKYYWKYRALSTSPSLYDAYSFKDGVLEIKDKYKPYLQGDNETVLDRIYSQTHQRAGLINGMNPDNDTPAYRASVIGAFVGSMRAWMLQNYQHLFVGGDSMSVLQKEERVTQTIHRDTTKSKKDNVYKKLTADQLDHRMCINHETGIPHDQLWIACMRCLLKLAKLLVLIPYGKITRKKYELSKPNRNERDGLWGILVATAIMFGVMFTSASVVKWAYQTPAPVDYTTAKGKPRPGKTKDAKLARSESRSFYPIERLMIEDGYNAITKGTKFDLNNYGYYKYGIGRKTIADISFRTWEGKFSAIDPTLALDIITSVFAGYEKGVSQNFELLNVLSDVLGISGKNPKDIVDRGSYRNYTRFEQALYRTASPINNLHTFTAYHGIDSNIGFYISKYGWFYKLFGVDMSKLKKAPEPPKKSKKKGSSKSKRGKSQHTKPRFNKPRFNKPAFNKPRFIKPRFK